MKRTGMPFFVLLLWLISGAVFAAISDYAFTDAQQEERFHKLIAEIRCPMCLNSNLAGSDAPIAADLRAKILEQLQEGQSDEEIMAFLKARYGDFISYRPPLKEGTILLWFGPLALLLAGFIVLRRMLKAQPAASSDTVLSSEELQHLNDLLAENKDTLHT